ncbi:MAG: DUF2062 domain-containing protein [Gemmatimonas sp.]
MNRAGTWIRTHGRRLLSENTSPVRLGVAVGVGVFFACTPFYGVQLWLALGVAWLCRLNKVAVAVGTQFSVPPMIPFIVFASAWIGEWLVHGRALSITRDQLRSTNVKDLAAQIGLAWTVGGVVVGIAAGTTIGAIVAIIAARRVRRASLNEDPWNPSGPAID